MYIHACKNHKKRCTLPASMLGRYTQSTIAVRTHFIEVHNPCIAGILQRVKNKLIIRFTG